MRVPSISTRKILPLCATVIIACGASSCGKSSNDGKQSCLVPTEQRDVFVKSDAGTKLPAADSLYYADEFDSITGAKYHTVRKSNGQLLRYNEYSSGDDSAWTRECEYNAEYYPNDGIKRETWNNLSDNTTCSYYYDPFSGNLTQIVNESPCGADTIFIGKKQI